MITRLLKVSLCMLLTFALVGFAVAKDVAKKSTDAKKMELVQKLATKKFHQNTTVKRHSAPIDVSNVDLSKVKTKVVKQMPTAMPIPDFYGDQIMQVDNFMAMAKVNGTSIGTSGLTYATAYQGRNIAMGSDGSIHVQWCDAGTPSNVVYYSKSTDGGATWTTPVVANDGYYGYKAAIDVDPNDPMKVHIVYIGYMNSGETRTARCVRSLDGGATWEPSVLVAGSNVNTNNPDIAVDQDGNPHVAFDSYADTFIRYNYSTDGGATFMAEPEVVNTGFGGETFGASVTIDNSGNPHVFFGGGGTAGSWGDKGTYWNWRDMASGAWQEVPPVELSPEGTGCPYPSMVFDSQGKGHAFYDAAGTTGQRGIWYRVYDPASGWAEATEIMPSIPGGSDMMAQAGIDDNDNIYIGYLDGLGGGMNLEPSEGDFFTGTNISGSWEFVNVSGNGPNVYESHPNVARRVLSSDSLFHCLYELGAGPVDIVYELGYPWPPNPKCGVNQLSDTYNLTGPFTVTATTSDLDGTTESCELFVWLNDEEVGSYPMTSVSPDVWQASFSVSAAPGDVISYQAKAIDNDGLEGLSFLTLVDVLAPENPGADILLVGDDMRIQAMYEEVLQDLGYVYEFWSIDEHAGIDASVTNWGWNNIILAGWGISSLPTRDYEGNPYAEFLDNGGNLALMSMDWYFGAGETDTDLEFAAGDFAADYLGLAAGTNDPGESADSMLIGLTDDPISGNWDAEPLMLNVGIWENAIGSTGANWIDWTTASTATDAFFAYNQGMGAGVWYDEGSFKTVFLPFMFSWLVDTTATGEVVANDDAFALMENILEFFGAGSPPVVEAMGPRYGVYGSGPFTVTANAVDEKLAKANGANAVVSMQLGYMVDDAADYTWVDMTAGDGGMYSGQIPAVAGDYVMYVVKATDDDGLSGMTMPYEFWLTGLSATEGAKVLYCGDDYYTWYYLSSVDSLVTSTLDEIAAAKGFTYDMWDVDMYGAPDYQTVLSNYTSVIWHGYGDWDASVFPMMTNDNPFGPFVANGGNLLFSSEEMLGQLYADADGNFQEASPLPGEAAYDILNVAWIGPDYNYDSLKVMSAEEPLTLGMSATMKMDELPFGYMGDIADPVNMDAYILDGWLGDAWYSDYGYGTSWRYTDPATGSKKVTLPFCLANIPAAERSIFLANVYEWFMLPTAVAKTDNGTLPTEFKLYNNYPNPFNPSTQIVFDIPKAADVQLAVYNVMGQKIRTLVTGNQAAGQYKTTWDGMNDQGLAVASGVYFYRIQAGDYVKSHKMMFVK
ncbi:T9SS type A sorting domain-containing protein [candidate division KSB1 bacterium]|nr:T9SS type A sorting domain-containing protein [candidate division KSB1 bacterium]